MSINELERSERARGRVLGRRRKRGRERGREKIKIKDMFHFSYLGFEEES